MNNKEFIAELAKKTGYSQDDSQKMIKTLLEGMSNAFATGDSLYMANFGTFEIKKRLERIMVNPSTGNKMLVPPKLVLNFRPVPAVKEKLKNGGEEDE